MNYQNSDKNSVQNFSSCSERKRIGTYMDDLRPKTLKLANMISAIQKKNMKLSTPFIQSRFVSQLFPKHAKIEVSGDQFILPREILKIMDEVVQSEINTAANRPDTDWFRHFATLGDDGNYQEKGTLDTLAYDHSKVGEEFTIGGEKLIRHKESHYIYPKGCEKDREVVTYPKLSAELDIYEGQDKELKEKARAKAIRTMIEQGITTKDKGAKPAPTSAFTQKTHLAVTTAALFGAETARTPRTFLSHMMLLDRLESQQSYGQAGIKKLTLNALLNPKKQEGESNTDFWNRKQARVNSITPVSGGNPQLHGGKAPMAGALTRKMGKAPIDGSLTLPQDFVTITSFTQILSLVQAKEVNSVIKWLSLQMDIDDFKKMSKDEAMAQIKELITERAQNYYLMTKEENKRREEEERQMQHDVYAKKLAHAMSAGKEYSESDFAAWAD